MTALVRGELLKLYWTRATSFFMAAAMLLAAFRVEVVLAGSAVRCLAAGS
jgi:hypothetical protein